MWKQHGVFSIFVWSLQDKKALLSPCACVTAINSCVSGFYLNTTWLISLDTMCPAAAHQSGGWERPFQVMAALCAPSTCDEKHSCFQPGRQTLPTVPWGVTVTQSWVQAVLSPMGCSQLQPSPPPHSCGHSWAVWVHPAGRLHRDPVEGWAHPSGTGDGAQGKLFQHHWTGLRKGPASASRWISTLSLPSVFTWSQKAHPWPALKPLGWSGSALPGHGEMYEAWQKLDLTWYLDNHVIHFDHNFDYRDLWEWMYDPVKWKKRIRAWEDDPNDGAVRGRSHQCGRCHEANWNGWQVSC